MPTFKFDKEKYLGLVKESGIQTTLTKLHQDIIQWEYQTFEGPEGYQPQMWEELNRARSFSRELWELALKNAV